MICPNCKREFFEGEENCPFCGSVITEEFIKSSTDLEGRKNKKSWKKIVIPIVAVILVLAIAGVVFFFMNNKNDTSPQKEDLKEILADNTDKTVVEYICKDFDSDGDYEAYAITSVLGKSGKYYQDADIWFVNSNGAHKLKNSVLCYLNGLIDINQKIFVSIEVKNTNNGDSYSYIYSAKNGKPIESDISGKYSGVVQENGEIVVKNKEDNDTESSEEQIVIKEEDLVKTEEVTTRAPENTKSENNTTNKADDNAAKPATTKPATTKSTTTKPTTTKSDSQKSTVSEWSKEEILNYYNNAVIKTNYINPSAQTKMSLGNGGLITADGGLGNLMNIISPVISSSLERNSTSINKIPGDGYIRLDDIKSIKATEKNGVISIEMALKEQTDGPVADGSAGPVGRAIGTLGNVDVALAELGADIPRGKDTISLTYTDVTVKVDINKKDGIIAGGRWHYLVEVLVKDADIHLVVKFGVKNLKASVDYNVVL